MNPRLLGNITGRSADVLRNVTCVYCGAHFCQERPRTREHVIGKKFVPHGAIRSCDWNLIGGACFDCNHSKSQLEGEISAITLQPDIGSPHETVAMREMAARKAAGAKSSVTGKLVKDSQESPSYKFSFGPNATIGFGFVAPPILRSKAVEELAQAHVQALFYLLTYDTDFRIGRFLPSGMWWNTFTRKTDWGNGTLKSFASSTASWPMPLFGSTAGGYFKFLLKRQAPASQVGAFALEWNRSVRVAGFFGTTEEVSRLVSQLPEEQWRQLSAIERIREEVPLLPGEDTLFSFV